MFACVYCRWVFYHQQSGAPAFSSTGDSISSHSGAFGHLFHGLSVFVFVLVVVASRSCCAVAFAFAFLTDHPLSDGAGIIPWTEVSSSTGSARITGKATHSSASSASGHALGSMRIQSEARDVLSLLRRPGYGTLFFLRIQHFV